MAQWIHPEFPSWLRNRSRVFLAFSWVSGLTAGLLVYSHASGVLSSLMRRVVYAPVSIVGSQVTFLLSFLFSAYAVFNHTTNWIYLIAAAKAFLFAFVSLGVLDSAGSAGWLLQSLLLLHDVLTMPVLYLYWYFGLTGENGRRTLAALWLLAGLFFFYCVSNRFLDPLFAEIGNL